MSNEKEREFEGNIYSAYREKRERERAKEIWIRCRA